MIFYTTAQNFEDSKMNNFLPVLCHKQWQNTTVLFVSRQQVRVEEIGNLSERWMCDPASFI